MCGIAGILTFRPQPALGQRVRAMTDALRYRGPDDEGVALFHGQRPQYECRGGPDTPPSLHAADLPYAPCAGDLNGDATLALGHRRLAIIDVSPAGHQPMCTPDGRYWITFNGEIYNYREIRAELEQRGEQFLNDSDTEVVLRAYRTWGPACLARFNGMWAFAIWDNVEKFLFCSRDRVGIKPFYYLHSPGAFVFASEIKGIIASGLYRPAPDLDSIYHLMSLQCGPRPRTCFQDVFALEPACWMTVDAQGRRRTQRFWSVPLGTVDESMTEAECVAEVSTTLERAVSRSLVADVPVGTFMSGGIDSTLMSALAARRHPGIEALTLAFRSGIPEFDRFDELPQARATAARYPMRHTVSDVTADDGPSAMADVMRVWEEPVYPFSPGYLLSRATAAAGLRVVLNGLGPDELLCGYWHHKLPCAWSRTTRWQKAVGRCVPGLTPTLRRWRTHARLPSYAHCFVTTFSHFPESAKRALFAPGAIRDPDTGTVVQGLYGRPDRDFRDAIEAACFYELHAYISNHHMASTDTEMMQFSLEGRFPYLDHEFIELTFRIPSRLKVQGETGKYILREVAGRYIDPMCLKMPKKGFSLPMAWWLRGPLRTFAADRMAALKQRGFLLPHAIDGVFHDSAHDADRAYQLAVLLGIEIWLEIFFDRSILNYGASPAQSEFTACTPNAYST